MASTPLSVILAYYFEARRNFVIVLSQVVIGLASFAASPVALRLVDTFGIRGTFIMVSGITAHLCIFAIICKPSENERLLKIKNKNENNADSKTSKWFTVIFRLFDTQVLHSLPFVLFLLSTMTWNFMLSVCLMHLPNYVITQGRQEFEVTTMMTVWSACNTFGRFLPLPTIDNKRIDNMVVHILCLAVSGVFTALFPYYGHIKGADYVFVATVGLLMGPPNSLMTSITLDLVGVDKISAAHGYEYLFAGLGLTLGSPFAGRCFFLP